MPGAQERVLRRRIGSIQNTKKITRAMELIAATRVVKAQTAGQRGAPLRRAHHPGDPGPGRRPAPTVDHPLLRHADEVRKVGVHRAGGRPRPGRCLQLRRSSRPPSARSWRPGPTATSTRSSPWAARPRRYFRFRQLPDRGVASRASPTTPPTRTPWPIAARVTDLFVNGGCRPHRPGVHPLHLDGLPGGRRPALPPARDRATTIAEQGDATATAGFEFEPSAERRARVAPAPLRRVPAVRRPCSTPRRPSSPAGSGP